MKLVADANVLLSAASGGRAGLVLSHREVEEVFTTEGTFSEVQEYVPVLARGRRLSLDSLLLAVAALPVILVDGSTYAHMMRRAQRLIGKRDPDDVEILALALHMGVPLSSNDNDFEESGVEWYTTAELLQRLGISRSG